MDWQQRTVTALGLIGLAVGLLPAPAPGATATAGDYATLTNAIAQAADGDTLLLTNNITVSAEVLVSSKGLTIEGNNHSISVPVPGLDASGITNAGPSAFRVFNISAIGKTNTLQNMTVIGGSPSTSGAGILNNFGTLVLQSVTVAQSGGSSCAGGGVVNNSGTLYLRDCNISRNAALYGGGFLNIGTGANIFIERCTFSENRSLRSNGGGGAGENDATLWANNSTFANNKSTELGGALNNYGGTSYLVDCTFVGNIAYGALQGGAIAHNGGTVTLVNSLFAYNYRNNGGTYVLNDINNYSGTAPLAYFCVFQSTTNQLGSGSVGTTLYSGDISGTNDTLFCGGASAMVLGPDGSQVGTGTIYQPFLAKVGSSQTPTAVLKTNSFAFGNGARAAFSSAPATPVVGYYSGSAWVALSGSSPASYEITTDQNGIDRGTSLTVGAVNSTASGLFMLKVNAATNGTVSGGTIYGDNYPAGTTVTLTAIPAAGYQFSAWNYILGGSGVASTANPFAITLTTNVTLLPVFTVYTGFTITYSGNGSTGGTVPSAQVVGAGGQATLAGAGTMVRSGYLFSCWDTRSDGNGTDYAPNATYSGPGNLSLYAKWTLIPSPTITVGPASQVVGTNGPVNLSVTVVGATPLAYQWFKNGGMVVGATNSALTFAGAGVTNSGSYYVVVTNVYGMSISQPATVTVGTPQLLAWGQNTSGQLGDGTTANRQLPESVASNVVAAAAGESHSLYLKGDGTLWAMGDNTYGQLGDGTTNQHTSPEAVASNVVAVAAGAWHSLYLKGDGTLWAVGDNIYGQLGNGTTTNRIIAVSMASNVVAVAGGGFHSLYLKGDGTLWAMGLNSSGELGNGTGIDSHSPVSVASNVVAVAAGAWHSLYLKGDGTLWAMGLNSYGQLGNGTGTDSHSPVSVASKVAALAAGQAHSLYLMADGTLWAMGWNGFGQLGDGTSINRSNAVAVVGNVTAVTAGYDHSLYLKGDGTLWAMGLNTYGQLGDGTTGYRLSPVSVPGMSLANIISGGMANHTLAVGLPLPPAITSQPTNQTAVASSNVTFTVTATGFAPLAYRWQFNGTNLTGATATNYSLTGAMAANAGNYTVVVSNSIGSVTSSVVVLTVTRATPTVSPWPTASGITYGQTLASSTLSGGVASVGGIFAFSTPTTAPGAGTTAQWVTFTPTDTTDYNALVTSINVTVGKATPTVSVLPTATAIIYGQTLASSALSGGTASVGGTFAFTTPSTAPGVGTASQAVTFTPTDTTDYNTVATSASVTVNKATPNVTAWPTASAIVYGQTLASSTLSGGAASVGGTFAFTTPATAPTAGTALQAVTFTPTDTTDYNTVSGSASVTVAKAPATVALHPTPLLAIYDGTAKSVTATTTPGGLTVTITYNGQSAPPTNAGSYTVIGTISDANYAGGVTNQLRVAIAGPAVAWGLGTSGQLGNGGLTNSSVPVASLNSGVLAGKTIISVAGGHTHSYALTSEGLVYAWGQNSLGQLGNNGTAASLVPVLVYTNGVLSGKKITALVSGENHALVLSADGKLFTWGWNGNLQLGNGTSVPYTNVPVAVDMTGVLAGKTVVALGTGNMHNEVVTSDGQLFTWGFGQCGQLGNGGTTNSSVPVAVNMTGALSGKKVIAASGGWEHTVALTSDGLAFAWGYGGNAQLGNGALTNSSVPVAVSTNGMLAGKTLVAIGSGEFHCLAVSSDGQVYSWGPSPNGELGNGTNIQSSVPVAVSTNGVLFGKKVVAVCGSYDSSTALTDDGQVFTWGNNACGELGNPACSSHSYVPVPVLNSGLLAGQTVLVISSSSQAYHTIALTVGLSAPALTSATNATATYGQAFTFAVTGNSVAGYSATGLPGWLAFNPATGILSGTPTNTGALSITLGATNAFGSTSGNLAITVVPATTTVSVASSLNPATYGTSVTFTATVAPSAASGTVTFMDGATILGSGTLNGGAATYAASGLTAGSHSITAQYGGDANYAASTNTLTQVVAQRPAVVSIASAANATITATFQGTVGATYVVYATTNLAAPGSWSAVATNVVGPGGTWTYGEATTNWPLRFFRAGIPH
jgi:uncharacterized repeat protein (TIGR02543 family)